MGWKVVSWLLLSCYAVTCAVAIAVHFLFDGSFSSFKVRPHAL